MSTDPYAGNLDFWEKAASIHGSAEDSPHYRFDVVAAGGTLMTPTEQRAVAAAMGGTADDPLAGVRDKDVLYLQSHLGADGGVMARAGARVTCADFSATALAKARELAERVGVRIETVETDSRAIPESLHGRFDLVYVTVGAICWIDDLDRWMRQVSLALRPGGRFVMVEIHPLYQMVFSRTPELVVDFDYGGGASESYTDSGSYAAPDADFVTTTTNYAHSVGDIVSGAVRAGLRVDVLDEHVTSDINPRGDDVLQRGDDGLWRLLVGRGKEEGSLPQPMPVYLTFIATKA
ncbi:MAG TPA: class I SAM-dependent methyltransferase [Candidatus Nanopelagicales bacterium]|nr:class I SAM-dependent methyltransferase [Candidatus Nanopelagicales bacterium]